MKEIKVITSKYSMSGAFLTYISRVVIVNGKVELRDTSRISQENAHCACSNNEAVWAAARTEEEVEALVLSTIAEMSETYSVEAEVEVENAVEEIATAEVTVSAATFETVEVTETANTEINNTGFKTYIGGITVKIGKINNFKIYGVKIGNFKNVGGGNIVTATIGGIRGSPSRRFSP